MSERDREAEMRKGSGMIFMLNLLLLSLGFRTEYEEGATCLRVFFSTSCSNVIGASIAIGTDHCRMEILLWGKHRNLIFECEELEFRELEIIHCVKCMALRVRELSGVKNLDTTCPECHDRRRIAEQLEEEEQARQHEAWKAKVEARAKADQDAALVAAQKEKTRAVEKAEEEEAIAQRAAARFLSDEELLCRVSEIRKKGPASVATIAKILQKTHDVTETRLRKLLKK
jgi:hypothetical protein